MTKPAQKMHWSTSLPAEILVPAGLLSMKLEALLGTGRLENTCKIIESNCKPNTGTGSQQCGVYFLDTLEFAEEEVSVGKEWV